MATPPESAPAKPRLLLPTTFGGVAALAEGPGAWLVAWQLATALTAALAVVFCLNAAWMPALEGAAAALPDRAVIRDGHLDWPEAGARVLHDGSLLSIVADPADRREFGFDSDLTLLLGRDGVALRSLLGWVFLPYPREGLLPLNRLEVTGLLATWRSPALAAVGAVTFAGLLLAWAVLAALYAACLWPLAGAFGRSMTGTTAWRLAAASLLPGALLMATALVFYSARQLSLIGLLAVVPLHLVVGWVFTAGGCTRLRRPAATGANPFLPQAREPAPARAGNPGNPFHRP